VAALVMTDVVNYTQKAASLPQKALMAMMTEHHALLESVAKRFGGRVVNTVADSSVLIFDSVTDALEAAIQIQRDHRGRLDLHVGVHVGEVTIGGGGSEVYGDAVNVAARAAKFGGAGSICLTEAARLALPNTRADLEDLGTPPLKGVGEPTRLFRLVL